MKRTRLDRVRESLRLQQVYNVFLRYGWDLAFQRWKLLGGLRRRMPLRSGTAPRLPSTRDPGASPSGGCTRPGIRRLT